MFRATGLDLAATGNRFVSVGLPWGSARPEGHRPPGRGPLVANVPSDLLTFRRLNVPPAGLEIRSRVVREELSCSLPFPLEEAVWDWTDGEDVASVLVAMRSHLEEVRGRSGDRARLDGEPLSYLRAARACGFEDALVLDFGASRTTMCAVKDGALEWVRVSFRGGNALDGRLAAARNLTPETAESLKKERGLELSECQEWLATLLEEALLPRPVPFEALLVCGGGAQMPGLREALADRLGLPAMPFPVPASLSPFRDVAAWGAALAARPGRPRIRLQPATRPETALRPWSMIWLVALLLVASVDLEVRHATLARRTAQQAEVLQVAVRQHAPDLARLPNEELLATLSRRVEAAREAARRSPVLLLTTLGRLAGPLQEQPGMEIRAVGFEEGVLTLEGQAGSAQQAEAFRSSLGAVLDKPELVENRAGAGGQTRFRLEGQVREP